MVEVGEKLDDAIRREVREETGLAIGSVRLFEIFERIMRDSEGKPEYHYVLMDYVCAPAGGTLRPGDDVSAARWALPSELDDYPLTEGTREVIERAFAEHADYQR